MDVSSFNNLHEMFTAPKDGFKFKIHPTQADFEEFNNIKKIVRNSLKDKIRNYLENRAISNIFPKFRVQGSWAYGTCNLPAKSNQEMDMDYGVYLPVRVFDCFNSQNDSAQARDYFKQIEQFLSELCTNQGWQLDNTKTTCIRMKIKDNAHVDVPLYAVPDEMFDNMKERDRLVLATEAVVFDQALGRNIIAINDWFAYDYTLEELKSIDLAEETLADKNIQTIHMAKRDGTWQSSDCEIIREWFTKKLKEFPDNGKQLRNICRYLKAWRDWAFESGAPSSILLMVIACKYYTFHKSRDDIALLEILENLPETLANDVYEDIQGHNREDFNRMNSNQREKARVLANDLHKIFLGNLVNNNKAHIISSMIAQWGNRMPTNEKLIVLNQSCEFDRPPLVQNIVTPQTPLRQG